MSLICVGPPIWCRFSAAWVQRCLGTKVPKGLRLHQHSQDIGPMIFPTLSEIVNLRRFVAQRCDSTNSEIQTEIYICIKLMTHPAKESCARSCWKILTSILKI